MTLSYMHNVIQTEICFITSPALESVLDSKVELGQ